MKTFNINQVGKILSVSPTTLRTWQKILSLNVERDSKGRRFYTQDLINTLQDIKQLLATGKNLEDVKSELNQDSATCGSSYSNYSKVEVLENENKDDFENKFELMLSPYNRRIEKLEKLNDQLAEENKTLIAQTAKLEERCNNKEDIIFFKDNSINDLKIRLKEAESRLNRKWWKVWK